jgi:hypothetical protein
MSQRSGIIAVAIASLAISLLTASYVWVRIEGKRRSASEADVVPRANIERLRQRGPVGAVKAGLFEIGNKTVFDASDVDFLLAVLRDPDEHSRSWNGTQSLGMHKWSEVETQSTRAIALVVMGESVLAKKLDDSTQTVFEDAMISSLGDRHPHIRLVGVNYVGKLGLISRPDVLPAVQRLTNDPDPRVVDMSNRALEYLHLEGSR